jgi:hypothetical protein
VQGASPWEGVARVGRAAPRRGEPFTTVRYWRPTGCTVTRGALVDVGCSLSCPALPHGHPDMARVAARWTPSGLDLWCKAHSLTPSGLDLWRPPAATQQAGAGSRCHRQCKSLSCRPRSRGAPPAVLQEGVPPAGGRNRLLSEKGVAVASSSTSSAERLRCACRPWPCLLEETGSLLAEQGYLGNSPAAHPGCGLTCKSACAWHRGLQELCKAATSSQQYPKQSEVYRPERLLAKSKYKKTWLVKIKWFSVMTLGYDNEDDIDRMDRDIDISIDGRLR